jgi:tetratricopeptide (TPR) repeat protein
VSADDATRREGRGQQPHDQKVDHLARGTLVGRYVVLDVLGEGGMGVVYAAYDPELDRKIAIKLLQAAHGESESGGQAWLLREAQAMARLSHPNVIAVHDVGTLSGDRVFVAMELVDGMTLRAWLREERPWRDVVSVMRAAGAGLAAAHAAGLVHRDFKPENVLVADRVRVMDFGLARLHAEDKPLDAVGTVVGTPAYIAPEIYDGRGADARTDQFSFGVALYEALYRVRPFSRDDLVAKRATAPKPPASANLPAWLERIVLQAIALDPAQRFASMDELLAALSVDPAATRRRVMIGAAIAVACGGLVVGGLALRGRKSELCTGAADKLAGVWDAGKRTALEVAFRKTGKPFAEDAIGGTEKALDSYASGWVAMHTEACEATRVRGEQTDDVLTLRMECLDNRLVELRTLVGLFGAADDKLIANAVASAGKLSPLADCADVAALRAPDPLPKDPSVRGQVTTVRAKIAEARALYAAGQLKEALAVTDAYGSRARELGHRPTEAELDLVAGEGKWQLSRGNNGEPELLEAVRAAEAGKADSIKLAAWLALVNMASDASRFDVAIDRWRFASAVLARLGDDWHMKVNLLSTLAVLHMRKGSYDDALAAAREGRTLAEQHEPGTDRPKTGYALAVEASVLATMGRSREAVEAYRKALPYKEALGARHIDLANTLVNLAGAELDLGRADDAAAHARRALDIEEAIYGPDSPEVARVLGMLGDALTAQNDNAGALAIYQRALAIVGATLGENDALYAATLGQLASALVALERPAEALPHLDRAIAIQSAKLGPEHYETLILMLRQCDALRDAGRVDAALDVCKRALASAEKSLGHDSPNLFDFLSRTGRTLLAAKQPREASAVLDRALKLGSPSPGDLKEVEQLAAKAREAR